MLGFESVPGAFEPCYPTNCAMGNSGKFQTSSKIYKCVARQRFKPGPTS